MNCRTLIRRETWMTQDEWRTLLRHRRAWLKLLDEHAQPLTPGIALRLQEYLLLQLLCARAERAYLAPTADVPPPVPTPEQFAHLAALHKHRRQALIHLEEALFPTNAETKPHLPAESPLAETLPAPAVAGPPDEAAAPSDHKFHPPAAPDTDANPLFPPTPQSPGLNRQARRHFAQLEQRAVRKAQKRARTTSDPVALACALS